MKQYWTVLIGILILSTASAGAQVVREEGTITIAGILTSDDEPSPFSNSFVFEGKAGQILAASIDSSIYQTHGRGGEAGGGCGSEVPEPPDSGGGCTGETGGGGSGGTGGGCGEDDGSEGCSEEGGGSYGGPLHLKLELLDTSKPPAEAKVCHAGRPNFPGWQRDPRLICALHPDGDEAQYQLKVSVAGMGPGSDPGSIGLDASSKIPYLLNISLRNIAEAEEGEQLTIENARSKCQNQF